MFPMVKDIAEFRAAREIFDRVQAEVQAGDVQLGVMIEIPRARCWRRAWPPRWISSPSAPTTRPRPPRHRPRPCRAVQADGLHPAVRRRSACRCGARPGQKGVRRTASDAQAVAVWWGWASTSCRCRQGRCPWSRRGCAVDLATARQHAETALRQATSDAVREALEAPRWRAC